MGNKRGYKEVVLILIVILTVLSLTKEVNAEELELVTKIEIPSRYKIVQVGEPVLVETEIIMVKEDKSRIDDVLIEYTIKDENGAIITRLSETKGGTLRINDVKEIEIPSTIKPGIYVVEVVVSYQGHSNKDSKQFEIMVNEEIIHFKEKNAQYKIILVLVFIVLFMFIILMIYLWIKFMKIEKKLRKVSEKDLKGKGLVKRGDK